MNEQLKDFADQADHYAITPGQEWDIVKFAEKFAELIVKDCADFVRENYDHEAAESIAWCMEIKYGLHGDYA